jgi:CRISPR-associated protein Cst2
MNTIKNISLVGRLTINLASLNNEGSEGNATQNRTATVVVDGQLYTVPVISGDMLKYWHAKHLGTLASERGLPLSRNSNMREANPNRFKSEINDPEWVAKNMPETATMSGKISGTARQPIEVALYREIAKACTVTDAHGLLVTDISPQGEKDEKSVFNASVAVARTSRVQVGFMTGIPEINETKHYFHAKYVKERSGNTSRDGGSNEGQNIFTRPATSAEFAIVVNIDLQGIGFDDSANKYVISETERAERQKAVLDALSYTLMNQPGANASQQFPHIMGFSGAIVSSTSRLPAPTMSPIQKDYLDQLTNVVKFANEMTAGNAITLFRTEKIADAIEELNRIGRVNSGS